MYYNITSGRFAYAIGIRKRCAFRRLTLTFWPWRSTPGLKSEVLTRSLGVRRSIVAHTGLELYAPLPFPLARRLSRRMLSRKALRLALIYSPGAADGGERAEHGALEA